MLSTIGYEKAELVDFVMTLKASKVEILIDIRERAQSRRRGFSKSALSEALEEVGIDYVHLRTLGDPKEGREAARAGNWARFKAVYHSVLRTREAIEALDQVAGLAKSHSICLMCYEREHLECHRKIVADHIERVVGRKFCHLKVRSLEENHVQERRMLRRHQSAAA
jgi:uncharacterized protein (DUF488 family)